MPKSFESSSIGGGRFVIHEGLPEELAMVVDEEFRTFNEVPLEPYVFKADFLVFSQDAMDSEMIEERDKTILYMHGQVKDGQWVPKDEKLAANGVTIPEIMEEYEKLTGQKIDFAYVCDENKVSGRVWVLNGKITVSISNPGDVLKAE